LSYTRRFLTGTSLGHPPRSTARYRPYRTWVVPLTQALVAMEPWGGGGGGTDFHSSRWPVVARGPGGKTPTKSGESAGYNRRSPACQRPSRRTIKGGLGSGPSRVSVVRYDGQTVIERRMLSVVRILSNSRAACHSERARETIATALQNNKSPWLGFERR